MPDDQLNKIILNKALIKLVTGGLVSAEIQLSDENSNRHYIINKFFKFTIYTMRVKLIHK